VGRESGRVVGHVGVEEVVVAPAGEVGLRRRTGGGQGGGGRGQAEVREDGARGERFAEEGDDAAPAAAAGAAQDVDREHALEERGPVEAARQDGGGDARRGGRGRVGIAGRDGGDGGDDGRAMTAVRREEAEIAHLMPAGRRDYRGETLEKGQGFNGGLVVIHPTAGM